MALTLDGTTGISATGNIYGNNMIVANALVVGSFSPAVISVSGNITGGNLITGGLISATGNITSVGNVAGNYILGNGALLTGVITSVANINSGTSNVTVVSSGGNVSIGVGGTSNVAVFATTGEYITGVVSASGNITGGNLLTGGIISATGNITGNYLLGNGSQLTGIDATSIQNGTSNVKVVSSGGNVSVGVGGSNIATIASTGLTVTGIASASGNVTGGNVLTAGQVSATGNVTGGNVNAGNITIAADLISSLGATLTIDPATVGNEGLVIINGNLQVNGTTTTINSNVVSTNDLTVNYANNAVNSAAANGGGIEVGPIGSPYITWLYNNIANTWTTAGGISATGDITGGNIATGGLISATANVTGGNLATGGTVSATGNVQAGNLRTGGLISATGAIQVGGDLSLVGNIVDTGPLTVSTSSNGNITLSPDGTGVIIASKNIINGQGNGVGNIGSATAYFNTIFAKATSAQYADLAELYVADATYTPGTVLDFGGAKEVTLSSVASSARVAGVVSTNPAHLMNSMIQDDSTVPVALQGRVPTSVTGSVRKGDMMVSAGTGFAQACATPSMGTVIGKALADFDGASGTIEIVVGRL